LSKISLDLKYSRPQLEIFFGDLAKYNVIRKGRRIGLTRGGAQAFCEYAGEEPQPMLWGDTVSTNIDRYFDIYFQPVLKQLKKSHWKWNSQKKELHIFDSRIDFRSADRPENWEGFGYKKVFLNEAGIILKNDYLYDNAVLPMMLDYPDSVLIAAGVPKGKQTKNGTHKFYSLWEEAVSDTTGKYRHLHYTSYDSPFIEKAEITALENTLDPETAKQEIYGEFLDHAVKPFMYCWDESLIRDDLEYQPELAVYLSFDFNVDPCTCLVWQEGRDWIYYIDEIFLDNSDIYEVCDVINAKYPGAHFLITGDASGRNRNAALKGRKNFYIIIKDKLNLKDAQITLPGKNPPIANSRILCNSILARHGSVYFSATGCKETIKDCKYVEVNDKGEKDGGKNKHRGHLLDCLIYSFNSFHHGFLKSNY
jgi:hypothetical protein